MRRPAAALAVVLALSGAGVVLPAVAASAPACAEAATHAGLVVDTGSSTTTYCVALDAPSVTGIHLIELASAQYGLQYSLGFGGKTVCQLAGVGPSGDDCWGDYPYFWGYWRGDGTGGWSWSSVGAASTSVGQGDMDGWTWGTGSTGSTHPSPPSLGFVDVCRISSPAPSQPPPTPPPTAGGGGGGGVSASSAPSTEPTAELSSPKLAGRDRPRAGSTPEVTAEPSPTAITSTIAAARPQVLGGGSGGGPPIATVVAVGVILILVIAGVLRLRRRSAPSSPSP